MCAIVYVCIHVDPLSLLHQLFLNDKYNLLVISHIVDARCFSTEFTANRLIVEDVFGWLKDRACVLSTSRDWARRLEKQDDMFRAAAKLHNFARQLRSSYALYTLAPH